MLTYIGKTHFVFPSLLIQDLHRTGCSSYCGQEAEQDRVVLKRVLLAYARWNKTVGYCQGFNVLAALILEVTEGNEGDALKVCLDVHKFCEFLYIVNSGCLGHFFQVISNQPEFTLCTLLLIKIKLK